MTLGNRRKPRSSQNKPSMETWTGEVVYATTWKLVCTIMAIWLEGGVGEARARARARVAETVAAGTVVTPRLKLGDECFL